MDLTTILPLLMMSGGSKSQNNKLAPLLSLLGNGSKPNEAELIGQLLGEKGGSPEMAAVLSKVLSDKKPTKKAEGFDPILGFVNDDILGKLTKYMNAKKQ